MYALSRMEIKNLVPFSNSVANTEAKSQESQLDKNVNNIINLQNKEKLEKIFSTTKSEVRISNVNFSLHRKNREQLKYYINNLELNMDKEEGEFLNIQKLIEKNIQDKKGLIISRENRGLVIRLKDSLLFDQASDIIKVKAQVTLDNLAVLLKTIPNSIRIEGHTDNEPIRTKQFPSNWELSTARSTNIVKYLVNKHNFNPGKLSAVGYGEYNALGDSNKATDRRVDIVILSSASKFFEPKAN